MNARTPFFDGSASPLVTGDVLNDTLVYATLVVAALGMMMVVAEVLLASGILQANRN